ncbi:hypothetical protein R3X26_16930 [Vibrio sp. TH_r3]|uniref:hypothetical protein n=1 Tax=Vibrio sp. TH_r3 TaxID=3082084 RepID=UPI0029539444|nr:hypothetical protein [Vibrio sp. TH_r3]MDV7106085.1 hypothetical protein [Vibrio sp. TH_r3]
MAKLLSRRITNSCELRVHTHAKSAFEFYHSQTFLFQLDEFDAQIVAEMDQLTTLHVTRFKDELLLFSGFEFCTFDMSTTDLANYLVIEHDELSDSDIERASWNSVMKSVLSSVDSLQLETLRRAINEDMPEYLRRNYFDAKKLSQTKIANHTHSSRPRLAKQYKKEKNKTRQPTSTSTDTAFFDELILKHDKNR